MPEKEIVKIYKSGIAYFAHAVHVMKSQGGVSVGLLIGNGEHGPRV